MAEPLVSKPGRLAPAPLLQNRLIFDPYSGRKLRIKIGARRRPGGQKPVAGGTVGLRGRESAVRRVAGEASLVARRRSLECAFLQPEGVFRQIPRWRRDEFIIRIALRHVSLVAIRATVCGL